MVDLHHIVTDGVSQGIFVREFKILYGGGKLPPLRLQYRDYATWMQTPARKKALEEQENSGWNSFPKVRPKVIPPFPF